jgi:hypothetical protein
MTNKFVIALALFLLNLMMGFRAHGCDQFTAENKSVLQDINTTDPVDREIRLEIAKKEKNYTVNLPMGTLRIATRHWTSDDPNGEYRVSLNLHCNKSEIPQPVFLSPNARTCGEDFHLCQFDSIRYDNNKTEITVVIRQINKHGRCLPAQPITIPLRGLCAN